MLGSGLLVLAVAACSGDGDEAVAPASAGGHTHAAGSGGPVSMLVGDGTRDTEVGYSLTDVRLPPEAGTPGTLSFRVERYDGTPVTDYLVEQTKDLHLYVVRDDLAVFRHLHPTMAEDGTWTVTTTLPEAGDYRVVTEFVAVDDAGGGDSLMLGAEATLPGDWEPAPPELGETNDNGTITVTATGTARVGLDERLTLRVQDEQGRPVKLGAYLGTEAHVAGFQREVGTAIHMHPLGVSNPTDDGTELTFHTEFAVPGDYVLFCQVRVDGFLHTVPVQVEVSGAAAG